jgi:hypothetical protein
MQFRFSMIGLLALTSPKLGFASDSAGELSTSALIQTWGTLYDADSDAQADPAGYGDAEADVGVSIRRARFGIHDVTGPIQFSLEVGMASPYDGWFNNNGHNNIGLIDANISRVYGDASAGTRISVGAMKTPFSREALISAADLTFQERGVATAHMATGRDVGVLADYQHKSGMRVRTGVFNGNNDLSGDDNNGVSSVSRLEYGSKNSYTLSGLGRAFGIGVSAVYANDLATNTVGGGADILVRTNNIGVLLEATALTITPADTSIANADVLTETKRLGLTGQLSYTLPTKSGGIELASRYSQYDDATALEDNGDVGIIHTGVTIHNPGHGIKVGMGMINRLELGGSTLSNDTVRAWLQYVPN